uniref:Uncharacterized protein n=1 Tax=Arundo donax TaxID=35708 RepID=A0A0A9G8Z7_ARUDO
MSNIEPHNYQSTAQVKRMSVHKE